MTRFFPRRRGLAYWTLSSVASICVTAGAYTWWRQPRPTPPTRIFKGVTYTCRRLQETDEGKGLVHVVRVELGEPGMGLYVTPLDPEAVARGFQYRLSSARDVAKDKDLAVVINGALFSSESGCLRLPGDWAKGVDTVVAEHEVSHAYPYNQMLWFEDDLTPHVEESRPPSSRVLKEARFGIGSQVLVLATGRVSSYLRHTPDRRTAVGVDTERKLLWLATFEHASGSVVARTLAEEGAKKAVLFDGGDSSTMFIGATDALPRTGTLLGGYRPVATFLGVKADPLER